MPTVETLSKLDRGAFMRLLANVERIEKTGTAAQRKQAQAVQADMAALSEAERIQIAFTEESGLKARERKLLTVLDGHPGATSEELTKAMGWKAQSWHMHFGTMCRDRLSLLIPPPEASERSTDEELAHFYSRLLADFNSDTRGFKLNAKARRALVAAGALPLHELVAAE